MKNCPLCGSADILDEESVRTSDLRQIHLRGLGFDPDNLFLDIPSLTLCSCRNCKLGFFFPFVSGDSDYYSKLGKVDWYYEHEGKEEFEYAKKYIQKGQRVLDVGAGVGRFGRYLTDAEYLGIELSEYAIAKANEDGINVTKKDLFELVNEKKEYFDVVASFQVIEHITHPKEFIGAMKELLRPGGILILATPNNDSKLFLTENMSLNSPPHHLLLWNRSSLEWCANDLRMKVENVYKEMVQDIHMAWFHRAMVKIILSKIFGFKLKKFETSFLVRGRNKIITLLAKLSLHFGLFDKDSKIEPGHSILVVLKK